MKKYFFYSVMMWLALPVLAAPTTQVSVSHPTTSASKTMPRTNVVVSHAATQTAVSRPTTQVAVTHPTTVPTLQKVNNPRGGGIGSNSGGGSYSASYKNAKTLAPAATPTPKAAKLGSRQNSLGIGTDSQAAAKDAMASAKKAQGESTQVSIDDVLKKTQLPGDLGSKLKQLNFAAEKGASAGKK